MRLLRAAEGYIQKLDLALVVAGPDKVPNTAFFPNGVSSATRSLGPIARALRATSDATIAARVGNHLVLDVDVRSDGPAQLAKLLARFGPLPPTWTQETATGGLHIWFQPAGFRTKGKLAKGVEALYGNRLVTLAPSARAGGVYRWIQHPLHTPLAKAPAWILDALRPPEVKEPSPSASDVPLADRERRARLWLEKAEPAIQGQHGAHRTMGVAVVVVRGFWLSKETAFQVMQDWNRNCDPPWNDRDLRRKIDQAHRYGDLEFGAYLTRKKEAA